MSTPSSKSSGPNSRNARQRLTNDYAPTSVAQHGSALARTTPEIEQVRDGVWAIPLPLPHAGVVESTLCYTLTDSTGGVHLIDPGWGTDDNRDRLEAGLSVTGFGLDDVRSITSTHLHPDHLGLGMLLRAEFGIPVALHRAEQAALARPMYPDPPATLDGWGVPPEHLDELATVAPRAKPAGIEVDVTLDDGDRLGIPGRDVRVIHTPGHTAGSICLYDATDELFFSGDHVLPIINPGLGLGGFSDDDDPIGAALDSYARVEAFDDAEVCPGHGYRFRGLAVRSRQIADRHRRRSAEIAALAAAEPGATVWTIASRVEWTDGWPNLRGFLRLSALAQTEMHLRHLGRATAGAAP
jgi:glyoxylase-like metal-dependent hydrolase (beta-lactamase superfamily II)